MARPAPIDSRPQAKNRRPEPNVRAHAARFRLYGVLCAATAVLLKAIGTLGLAADVWPFAVANVFTNIALLVLASYVMYVFTRTREVRRGAYVFFAALCLLAAAQMVSVSATLDIFDLHPLIATYLRPLAEILVFCMGAALMVVAFAISVSKVDRTRQRLAQEQRDLMDEVAERKLIEEALRESEEKYRSLVDSFPHGVVILQDNRIAFANTAATSILRTGADKELLGTGALSFVAPEDRLRVDSFRQERVEAGLRSAEAPQTTPEEYEATLQRADGEPFPALLNVRPISFNRRFALQVVFMDLTEQRRIEKLSRESQRMLRTLIRNLSGMVYRAKHDQDRTLEFVSDGCKTLTGYGPRALTGNRELSFGSLISPADRERVWESIDQAVVAHTPFRLTYRIESEKGVRWAWEQGRGVYDREGSLVAIEGFIADITEQREAEDAARRSASLAEANKRLEQEIVERQKAEEALRVSENRYRTLAEAAQDVIFIVGPDDAVLYVNSFAASMFGVDATSIVGRNRAELFGPEAAKRQKESLNRVFSAGQPLRLESRLLFGGRELWQDTHLVPLFRGDGQVRAVLGVSRDITERKNAEDALRASEQKYRGLIEGLSEAVYQVSLADGTFLYVGPAALHVFGYTAGEFTRDPALFRRILHPEDADPIEEARAALTAGMPLPLSTYRVIDGDGEERWILQSSALVSDTEGAPVAIEGICRNVTGEKRAQQTIEEHRARLLEASRMSILGEMAASTAHEINNPLNVISGSSEQLVTVLNHPTLAAEAVPKLADAIVRNVFRMKKIIHGLRSFARDDSRDPLTEASLKAIVDDTVVLCQEQFKSHRVLLEVADIPDALKIECRPTQLMEVLTNLLSNALHAVEDCETRTVKVDVSDTGDMVEISVTDTGSGIQPEVVGRIFEPFVSARKDRKGTGLGLSISKRIVEGLNGELFVDGSSPLTRFVVRLPRHHIS